MFNPYAYYNTRDDGFPVLEVVPAHPAQPVEPAEESLEPRQFVPLRQTTLRGRVAGPLADLVLTQVFAFSAAACPAVVEAVYRFPLPGDAAVRGVQVRFGEVTVTAGLKARAEAEADYAAAKEAGKQAALATRAGANTFMLRLAGLKPDEPVTVETRYVQVARPEGAGWSLRTPLTLAPRYVRQDEAQSAGEEQPLGLLRDPGHTFNLELTLAGAQTVTSPTHALTVAPGDAGLVVRLAEGNVIPDRDLVLVWSPPQQTERPVLHALAHADAAEGVLYFLAQVAPPRLESSGAPPREVTLLVDHSGSMRGPKWEAADWATEHLLRGLRPQDSFALGVFHNQPFWFERTLQPGQPGTVARAVAWLKTHQESGGTELGMALEQALMLPRGAAADAARAVLIVTDGQVTDQARLFQMADREFAGPARRRISVLCIDSAPNDYLARQLAERGGGVARFLTSSPDEEDITTALDEILADWAAPALAGLRLAVNRQTAIAVGRRPVEAHHGWPALDLGDLPSGRTIWVVGRTPLAENELALRLALDNGTGVAAVTATVGDYRAIPTLFAAQRIAELEYLAHARGLAPHAIEARLAALGYAPAQLRAPAGQTPLYAENRPVNWQVQMTRLLVEESLAHQVPCSETAFVAVRAEAGEKATQTVEVANALPAGWSEDFSLMAPAAAPSTRSMVQTAAFQMRAAPPMASLGAAGPSADTLFQKVVRTFAPGARPQSRPPTGAPAQAETGRVIFSGRLAGLSLPAVLLDVTGDDPIPAGGTLRAVEITCDAAADQALAGAPGLVLAIYIGDPGSPRATVRLRDLAAAGRRPLNLRRLGREAIRVVLEDRSGAGVPGTGQVRLRLVW
jgi:Ca-activated chloride channel family protein